MIWDVKLRHTRKLKKYISCYFTTAKIRFSISRLSRLCEGMDLIKIPRPEFLLELMFHHRILAIPFVDDKVYTCS